MSRHQLALILLALVLCSPMPRAIATGSEPAIPQVDPAPCMAAAIVNDDDGIVSACGIVIDSDKTERADRIKALIARAGVWQRRDMIDRAIEDYGTVLRLDPSQADILNARGELWRKKGDRPKALQDFGAALKLNPNHPLAKANYKSLALELERLGALLAVNNKPSFNCAAAKRPVEKAICDNPELANLDREINAVNTRVVGDASRADRRAGRALQREQDDFLARRNAAFGQGDYDLQKAMRERLDHLLAIGH
ncbi:MAG: tetratricopeptide repeat protein [Bradyrhizobium sp.]|nr:tetratricopeptide repeat protein [Pseudomonadota bacterium]MDE2067474.1 tetratricopeptide repeat protein [Bradyrhizobium sp.]MDE2241638.1 tetratricopeptide repeat protein [Bradyrhizobium sp.]